LIPRKKQVQDGTGPGGSFIPPIAFLEMLDARSTRHPIRISNVRIGRGRDNDLVIQNDSVSSNHCVLKQSRDGVWTIVDLKSGNGVFVNDQRVEEAILREGDMLELGEVKMRFYEAV
jgi:pSer/pThr/pTyr-binding forkhead associated (FHA) protein